jgi:hypothetical protein
MKTRLVLLVLTALLLSAELGAAADWVFYSEGPPFPGSKYRASWYYYDKSSIRNVEPGVFEINHLIVWTDPADIYTIAQYWIDCGKMQISIGKSVNYVKKAKLTEGNFFKMGWFAPRDYGEKKLLQIICIER